MLGAARAYAEANQATLLTPFILAGAMAPVTAAGVCAQTLAEALGGMTFVQLVRPGAPVVLGSLRELDVDAVGRADVRDAGARARAVRDGRAGPPARRARSAPAASLCASKVADAQAAYESRRHAPADDPRRRQLRAPRRRLARGRARRRLREVHPRRRPVRDDGRLRQGRRPVARTARRSTRSSSNGPGQHFLGTAHTLANFETRLLPLRDRRQQQLRAVAGGRLARRRPAGQRDLEADARRVRGAADRPRRSTRRCSSSSPGARRRCRTPRSSAACSSAAARALDAGRAARRSRGVLARADVRARSRSRTRSTRRRSCRRVRPCR